LDKPDGTKRCFPHMFRDTVAERTTEIGIRMALSAQPTKITAMILSKAATLLAVGMNLSPTTPLRPRISMSTQSPSLLSRGSGGKQKVALANRH